VQSYLETEFLSGKTCAGGRLPTIAQLAAHLEVSVPTVRGVVRKLVKEGKLETVQGRGTFIQKSEQKNNKALVIGTMLGAFQFSPSWSQEVYLGAVHMAATMRRNISVMPILSFDDDLKVISELQKQMDHIDMLLHFGLYSENSEIRKASGNLVSAYEDAGKPTVSINPSSVDATANFVAANYYESANHLGRAWYETGRRNIYFLLTGGNPTTISPQLVQAGFINGCRENMDSNVSFRAIRVSAEDVVTDPAFEKDIQVAVQNILAESGPAPDAII
jgi:DNA-binding LacI/PurR family transcriptional regulator